MAQKIESPFSIYNLSNYIKIVNTLMINMIDNQSIRLDSAMIDIAEDISPDERILSFDKTMDHHKPKKQKQRKAKKIKKRRGRRSEKKKEKKKERRSMEGDKNFYKFLFRHYTKPYFLKKYPKLNYKKGFNKTHRKIFCCDSLAGILLCFRKYHPSKKEFLQGIESLESDLRQEIKGNIGIEKNQFRLTKVHAFKKMLKKYDGQKVINVKQFFQIIIGAGNRNKAEAQKQIREYKQKEKQLNKFLSISQTK